MTVAPTLLRNTSSLAALVLSVRVVEEEMVVDKRAVVKEEIRIKEDVVEEEEIVEEDVRNE